MAHGIDQLFLQLFIVWSSLMSSIYSQVKDICFEDDNPNAMLMLASKSKLLKQSCDIQCLNYLSYRYQHKW